MALFQNEFRVSEKQFNDAKEAFKLFDKKGEGRVPMKELYNVFKSLALQVENDKLKNWADEQDEDGTGFIDWDRFKLLFERKLREDEDERELKDAFRVLDKNNRGVIDVADLRWILKSLGDDLTDDEIEDMIEETDTDRSGTVDYEEFRHLMMA
ncbi:troponin C-like isoform X2 [Liolophura sinensis]|uniref:troponin C-like isoform X2 n=1 Tax=Liolophura sinensis TaxID=3198878 RepID=UPI0031589619